MSKRRRHVPQYYILDDLGRPLGVDDVLIWGAWFETHREGDRVVEQTVIGDRLFVSTVFLGLDHNFGAFLRDDPDAPPILWETMTFYHNGWDPSPSGAVDWSDIDQERYASLEAAKKGHRRLCNLAARRLQEYDAAVARKK